VSSDKWRGNRPGGYGIFIGAELSKPCFIETSFYRNFVLLTLCLIKTSLYRNPILLKFRLIMIVRACSVTNTCGRIFVWDDCAVGRGCCGCGMWR